MVIRCIWQRSNKNMSDDKYIGIEVLANTVNSMTEMIDDRNGLLNSMFKKDVYNDFLMSETAQGGVGGAGVDNEAISSMGGGAPDLSTPMMPARNSYVNVETMVVVLVVETLVVLVKMVHLDPTRNFNKGGVSTPPSTSS